jgi:K+-transporting ATPase ATPase C chain
MVRRIIRPTLLLLLSFTVLLGLLYPSVVTGLARLFFPTKATGSLVLFHGETVGSALIGQPFSDAKYFWGRPSASSLLPHQAMVSTGSNLGPTNPHFLAVVTARVRALRAADPGNPLPVPIELVTASGSGLDPHISPSAAHFQVSRVARAQGLPEPRVHQLVEQGTEHWPMGLFGEPRVNVLLLNLALKRYERSDSQ